MAPSRPTPIALALHGVLLALACTAFSAAAQTAPAADAADAASVQAYRIPAGALDQALTGFAAQAGISLTMPPALVLGKTSTGLHGSFAVREGLARLLAGSGLEAVGGPGGAFALRPAASSPGAAQALPAVTVTARAERSATTEGTGSYTTAATGAATRMELSLRETPQSVTVVTRQQMDDQAVTRLEDVLNLSPGVVVRNKSTDDGDGSNSLYTYARGAQITNYQIDGMPTTAGGLGADMAAYDRVEVVRGATGLLNGAGNPAAAVNLVRKRPTQDFAGSVQASVGNWDRQRVEADVSGPLTADGRVRGRLVGVAQDNHSYIDRLHDERSLAYGVLEVDLAPGSLLTVGASAQRDRINGAAYWAGVGNGLWSDGTVIQYDRSFNPAAEWSYFHRDTRELFASLAQRLDNGWQAQLALRSLDRTVDELLGYAGRGYPNQATGAGTRLWVNYWPYTEKHQVLDAYASGPFQWLGRQHDAVLGATAARHVRTDDSYPNWSGPTGYDPTVPNIHQWNGTAARPDFSGTYQGNYSTTTSQFGVFGSARFKPADGLAVIVGSRVNQWKEDARWTDNSHAIRQESGVLVPYLGVVLDLDAQHTVYASHTGIFNPQTSQNASGQYLEPERGSNRELGLKSSFFGGRLNTSVAVFQARKDKLAVEDGSNLTPSGEQAYVAVDNTRTRGYELEVSGALQPRWQIQAGFTHAVARTSDGARLLTDTPDNLAKLSTSYRFSGALEALTLGGGLTWMGRTYSLKAYPVGNPTTAEQSAWATLDAMARYAFTPQLSLVLNVKNLTDKKYFASTKTLVYGAPRSVQLTARYQF